MKNLRMSVFRKGRSNPRFGFFTFFASLSQKVPLVQHVSDFTISDLSKPQTTFNHHQLPSLKLKIQLNSDNMNGKKKSGNKSGANPSTNRQGKHVSFSLVNDSETYSDNSVEFRLHDDIKYTKT